MNIRVSTVLAVVGLFAIVAAASGPVTTVTVDNTSEAARPAGPVTFGAFFAKGDVPQSVAVDGLPTEAVIKRRWADASVKHAVLTVGIPAIAAGGSRKLTLIRRIEPPRIAVPLAMPKQLPDLKVRFRIQNGPTVTASLRRAAAVESPRCWLPGELVTEWLLKDVPVDPETGKADPELEVRFHLRYYPATKSFRVVCVVENCKWTSAGTVPYDVAILEGDKELFSQKDVGAWPDKPDVRGHTKWSRWVKRFWIGRKLDDVNVRYEKKYIFATNLLPQIQAGSGQD